MVKGVDMSEVRLLVGAALALLTVTSLVVDETKVEDSHMASETDE